MALPRVLPPSRAGKGLAVAGIVLLVLAGVVEVGFRALAPAATQQSLARLRRTLLSGLSSEWAPHPYTVFRRWPDTRSANSQGFSDREWKRIRRPGVPRIACLGGSTTEGGNTQGREGSYPRLLERVLEERTGRDFEVLNAGISGWTSAEMLIAWFLTVQDFQPDVVVLHEAVNDLEPRQRSDFASDYSHWRRPFQIRPAVGIERWLLQWSELYVYWRLRNGRAPRLLDVCTETRTAREPLLDQGRLPHATSFAFRRNILSIARSARAEGRTVVLVTLPTSPTAESRDFWRFGVRENNGHLRELCAEHGFLLADAEQVFRERPELDAEFTDLVHLEPRGNRAKAEVVADALAAWVAGLSPADARPPRRN